MSIHYHQMEIYREDVCYNIQIEFDISPYVPAMGPECPWGGQPAEGGEVDIIEIINIDTNQTFDVTADEEKSIMNELFDIEVEYDDQYEYDFD